MKVRFRHKGDLSKTKKFMERARELIRIGRFDEYGRLGVKALTEVTPKKTGKTANSWDYQIERSRGSVTIYWTNSNINEGVNIAVILQFGHGTGNGAYVEGIDYIRPAMRPVFDKIADDAWKEVVDG